MFHLEMFSFEIRACYSYWCCWCNSVKFPLLSWLSAEYWRKSYFMSYPPFLKFIVTSVFLHVVLMVHFFVPSVISLCGVVCVVHWTLIKWIQNILFWNKLWHNYPFFTFFATLCFIGCRLRKFHDINVIQCILFLDYNISLLLFMSLHAHFYFLII